MTRFLATLALICALAWPALAEARPHHHGFCTPVYIEGAGTVLICAPNRGR